MTDFKELREALDAGPTDGPWIAAGPSFGDPLPAYCVEVVIDRDDPEDCETVCQAPPECETEVTVDMHYIAAANPSVIRSLLAELDAARRDAERWRTFIGLGHEIRAEWAANLSLAPVLTSWVDAAMKEQQP